MPLMSIGILAASIRSRDRRLHETDFPTLSTQQEMQQPGSWYGACVLKGSEQHLIGVNQFRLSR